MKNWILYFYDINIVNDIHQSKNKCKFIYNNDNYVLNKISSSEVKQVMDEVSKIYGFYSVLKMHGVKCNDIILNKNNEIISFIDDNAYVLTKTYQEFEKVVNAEDIINYTYKLESAIGNKQNNWKELWINKIDYHEYQINQFGLKFPMVRESFSYFSGIAENAISLLNFISNDDLYVSHKRIHMETTYYDLYDPFNMIFDTRVRDIAEYAKDCFIHNRKTSIYNYFTMVNLTEKEKALFFVRMMFPSFYFDAYEKVIEDENETAMLKIINKNNDYELLLLELLNYINSSKPLIPRIEWLEKKQS